MSPNFDTMWTIWRDILRIVSSFAVDERYIPSLTGGRYVSVIENERRIVEPATVGK